MARMKREDRDLLTLVHGVLCFDPLDLARYTEGSKQRWLYKLWFGAGGFEFGSGGPVDVEEGDGEQGWEPEVFTKMPKTTMSVGNTTAMVSTADGLSVTYHCTPGFRVRDGR